MKSENIAQIQIFLEKKHFVPDDLKALLEIMGYKVLSINYKEIGDKNAGIRIEYSKSGHCW